MFMAKRKNFTWEDRKRIIQRLLPPESISVKELAAEIGVSDVTIYDWRKKINSGYLDKKSNNDKKYSVEDKFHIVLETYSLNEGELNTYCREKGLYPATVKKWQQNAIKGIEGPKSIVNTIEIRSELKKAKEDSKKLKSELNYKDKALAETAALLVLRKKANAIWGDPEEK